MTIFFLLKKFNLEQKTSPSCISNRLLKPGPQPPTASLIYLSVAYLVFIKLLVSAP